MARPSSTTCTVSNYISAASCTGNLDAHERRAFMVYLKVRELAALGGTDYREQLGNGGTLVEAAACIYQSLNPHQRALARLVIQRDNTSSTGVTILDLTTPIACLKDFDDTTLDAMDIHLTCLLGRHSAWPQVNL